jgi:K+-sensing histidine kinase KdpD
MPKEGRVELSLYHDCNESVTRLGIAAAEHGFEARQFYRSDKSRTNPSLGLGLSFVAAIVKLHGFRLTIWPVSGCVAEIAGRRAAV